MHRYEGFAVLYYKFTVDFIVLEMHVRQQGYWLYFQYQDVNDHSWFEKEKLLNVLVC